MSQVEETPRGPQAGEPEFQPFADVGRVCYRGLEALASLKLTVALFALSILLVWFGTLAQAHQDIYEVLRQYFKAGIAWVDLKIFFPPSFFPDPPDVSGSLPFPGGATIGTLLFVNLLAAHGIRFKVQSGGSRLWGGIGVVALGALATWLVIASGSNKDGFQGISVDDQFWNVLWQGMKFGLGLLWVGMASSLLKIKSDRTFERWTVGTLSVLLGVGLVFLFYKGDEARLNPESMRILWQLIKAEFAALILLGGSYLVFRKRAGIVVIHAGVGLMMFSELLVSMTNVESQMPIHEGETVNFTQDAREFEFAVIDRSAKDHNAEVVVSEKRLTRAAGQKPDETGLKAVWTAIKEALGSDESEEAGAAISDDRLPFDVKVVKFLPNSKYRTEIGPDDDSPANRGAGNHVTVDPAEKGTGADSDAKFNNPSAYVELIDKKSNKSLGVYLVSTYLLEQGVRVDGKTYEIALRYKRAYKPYSIHLIDVRSDKYIGTETVRNYSSDIQLVDKSRDVNRKIKIWMNNPLRYAGETFYQSGYTPPSPVYSSAVDPDTGLKLGAPVPRMVDGQMLRRETTSLQIVKNTGWMIPYVSCMIVFTGMLYHFWLALVRFLNRRAAGVIATGTGATAIVPVVSEATARNMGAGRPPEPPGASSLPSWLQERRAAVWFPIVVCVVIGGYLASKMYSRPYVKDDMNLTEFGKLPVVAHARLKPFDSFARNHLRSLSVTQSFRDADDEKRPAIQWFLDAVTKPEEAAKYRIFRIESLEVLQLLGLPRREGYRYSLYEIVRQRDDNRKALAEQARRANEVDSKHWNAFQRSVMSLWRQMGTYQAIQRAFAIPPADVAGSRDELRQFVQRYGDRVSVVPLSIPANDDEERKWQTLATHSGRIWVRRYAEAAKLQSVPEVAIDLFVSGMPGEKRQVLEMVLKNRPELKETNARLSFLLRVLDEGEKSEFRDFYMRLAELMEGEKLAGEDRPAAVLLTEILTAYRDGNAEAFNTGVAKYRDLLAEIEPQDYDANKLRFESAFNQFEPYFYTAFVYLLAFVISALAWLGWSKPLNRAAFGLVGIAFVIHTVSLIARMYLSGRWGVTVTNLYSSAVFIGWAACLLGMILEGVYRMGIGNTIAAVSGFASLFVAHFLSLDGDTISVMQAVLDTNFWLATHVTTITLGYATTFVAWLLGIMYITRGMLTPSLTQSEGKTINRMIYGTLCFAIFFSFIGTVLGGLWADDSWGRFWGWDPKENGALIIVLWNALVLHARWGGIVKDRGMAVLAVGGGIVTAWSWFGVNLLSVGLHSYGFKSGMGFWLGLFVAACTAIIGLGCAPKELWWSLRRQEEQA
jgi:ABC-type transport system involved in cytochrome c biogenesis permease subunit